MSAKFALALLFLATAANGVSASLSHDYLLQGSLDDSLGGPSLTSNGGTISADGYSFGANQGLSLSGGLASGGDYSIAMVMSFSDLDGYRKILDFQDLGSDDGFYNLDSALNFYNFTTGSFGALAVDTPATVVLTRDGTSDDVAGYVDGTQQFSFTDTGGAAIFSTAGNLINFFEDDNVTGQREASGGDVTRIQIYDGALTADEVANLNLATPEPATWTMLGMGALGLLAVAARRRRIS